MALYIHAAEAIAPQPVFQSEKLEMKVLPLENPWYSCLHPDYKLFIPPASLRRMSPVIRMGLASSLSCMKAAGRESADAIVIGSGLGCVRDTIKFLTQVNEQDEQLLNPTAFIQSTHNTVSGQIALALKCRAYNLTFSQKTLSFESALLDAILISEEEPAKNILLGGLDEVNEESYGLLLKAGCVRDARTGDILESRKAGAVAGEGSAFFLVSGETGERPMAMIRDVEIIPGKKDSGKLSDRLALFLERNNLAASDIDLLVGGRNGDLRYVEWYREIENLFPASKHVSYKHLTGEYDTASAFSLFLAARILTEKHIPESCLVKDGKRGSLKHVLLFNQSKGRDFSFILLSCP